MNGSKKKIAILGGGLGSMTTAFWLTNQPGWQDQYEITVYQVGWRLGGKGASGRGPNGRIEEHGLHIWIGFYDNAFRMIQQVYDELQRPPTHPLSTWEKAFTPHSFIVIAENWKNTWRNWSLDFPTNPRVPGDAGEYLSIWDYLYEGLQAIFGHFREHYENHPAFQEHPDVKHGWLQNLEQKVGRFFGRIEETVASTLLKEAIALAERHKTEKRQGSQSQHGELHVILEHVHAWFAHRAETLLNNDDLRRFWILVDLGFAMGKGILADIAGNEQNGFDEIDRLDFREWLSQNGATDVGVWSAPVQALYDLVFGYENGEVEKPNFGAGAALLSTLRIGLDYKGAIFWKMNAGMGDTIFQPIYEALKARGVKFEFFHRVENLGLSADKSKVETIRIGRQVTLTGDYDPFIPVEGMDCWPSQPNYEHIKEAKELQDQKINLESFWTPWQNVETRTLTLGQDFDEIVLGISIASLPYVCPELLDASEKWRNMCGQVGTVQTMAMQWWMQPDLKGLGWTLPSPVMDAYVEPMNTWADMSFLLDRESWPPGDEARQISYFCGPMVGIIPNPNDHGFPGRALNEVKEVGRQFAKEDVAFLWPKAVNADGSLDESKLCGSMDNQFFRANIDPSERYVLSLKGSVYHRLKPNESGFSNLFLTGDWTYNYFNAGCVEATVVSGMLCSNAVCGFPELKNIEGVRYNGLL